MTGSVFRDIVAACAGWGAADIAGTLIKAVPTHRRRWRAMRRQKAVVVAAVDRMMEAWRRDGVDEAELARIRTLALAAYRPLVPWRLAPLAFGDDCSIEITVTQDAAPLTGGGGGDEATPRAMTGRGVRSDRQTGVARPGADSESA